MYKDCVDTVVSDLAFYGKVLVRYIEKNDEAIVLKFILNKNKSVLGNIVSPNGFIIESLDFNTVKEMIEHLEKIRDRIICISIN